MRTRTITLTEEPAHSFIRWEMTAPWSITEDEAQWMMARAGYPHQGYGFYGFRTKEAPDGGFVATWECASSCD